MVEHTVNSTDKELIEMEKTTASLAFDYSLTYELDDNNQWTYNIDWTNFYGEVAPGTYKLKKSVYDNGYTDIYTEAFEIK